MPINLSNKDHRKLDKSLDIVLDAYASNEVSLLQARSLLAHVITAATKDNEAEIISFMDEHYMKRWKENCKNV